MKLNWTCFYDVLETIEKASKVRSNLPFSTFNAVAEKYGEEQVKYCLHQAYYDDLLLGNNPLDPQGSYISTSDLSLKGHRLLLSYRNKE